MKLKLRVCIVTVLFVLSLIMLYMYLTHIKVESNNEDTLKYKVNNSYLINNNMEQGLWGFNAINYNYSVQKTIDERRKKLNSIKVAILDTGIDYTHPDLKENIVEGYDFVNHDNEPIDDNGHGTQIAGIIGGKYTGTSYGVKLMPVKILDKKGLGKTDAFVKGILWAVDNGADVINLSIGRRKHESFGLSVTGEDSFNELEYKAIKYALINDVAVVTVSGDFNVSEVCYPAAYKYNDIDDNPIIVTGINQYNEKANMSNYSDDINVSAPGEYVLTTTPIDFDKGDNDYININNDGYIYCQGTSFAAAYVTGIAAIIKSYKPTCTNKYIRELITTKAKDIGDKGRDNLTGNGIIDYYSIIESLK